MENSKESFLAALGKHKFVMAGLLVIGVVLIIAGSIGSSGSGDSRTTSSEPTDYESTLERRLEELCLSVAGIDRAKVFVTVDSGTGSSGATGVFGTSSYRTGEEVTPTVRGVAAVVTRGDDANVKKTLTELIASSLGIPTNRVSIAPCK